MQTFEEASRWGSKIILDDLKKNVPELAKKDSETFFRTIKNIQEKAKILLKKLEMYEGLEKKSDKYTATQSSVELYKYYADAKNAQYLQRIVKEAYAFVAYLRKWFTGTTIDYLIESVQGKNIKLLHLSLENMIDQMNLGVSSSKSFRLSLSPMGMTNQKINEAVRFQNFEKDLQTIEANLLTILQKITQRANKKQGISTRRIMHNYGIKGSKLNKGFVTETALNMFAVFGSAAANIKDPDKLAEAYISTVGNLPGFRGGDLDENITKMLLEKLGSDFNKKLEFQVKRVSGLFGASVIEINTLKYELFNIATLLNLLQTKGMDQVKKEMYNYFTNKNQTAYDFLTKELKNILSKELDLKDLPNSLN